LNSLNWVHHEVLDQVVLNVDQSMHQVAREFHIFIKGVGAFSIGYTPLRIFFSFYYFYVVAGVVI
jgi:hypothetical protein